MEIRRINSKLCEAIKFKESLWRKKSKIAWLKEGDSNLVFFHKAVKMRTKKRAIQGLKIGERWNSEPKDMKEKMFDHFSKFFSCQLRLWKMKLDINFKRIERK